jgi:3-oxoacyl-[acyl-carrier-protein] synthase-1
MAVAVALREGRSGLAVPAFPTPSGSPYGLVPVLPELPPGLASFDTRQARIAAHLAERIAPAVARTIARHTAERVGVVIGTSTGGIGHTETAVAERLRTGALPRSFDLWRQHQMSATADVVARVTGARGPALVVSTACSSSGKSFGTARRWLRAGVVDAVIVGGVDSLCRLTLRGFAALELLSEQPCRPFSQLRSGISLGEAGALLLVENGGDGPATLLGVGESSDAHHMSAPHPEGLGAALAMQRALADAGLTSDAVGHINAHGTATMQGDIAEALAIARVLGPEVPVSATKGYTGHTLGAAGATEAVLTLIALTTGQLPASVHADPVDPALPIDIITHARPVPPGVALSNSFAFGGSNVSVVFGGPP